MSEQDDITKITKGKKNHPPRIILYGVNKIGKTTFASTAPSPIFLQVEDGSGDLELSAFPMPETYDDFMNQLRFLAMKPHDYKTVVVDTLDALEHLIFKKVCADTGKENIQNIEDIGYAKGYTYAADYWRKVCEALDYLCKKRDMIVLLLAQSLVKTFNSPEHAPFDQYRFDLNDKGASVLRDWADCVLFANYKVYLKKTDEKFGKDKLIGIGQGERVVYTEMRPAFWAGNRYSLPFEMPLSWQAFDEGYRNGKNAKSETQKA